MTLPASSDANLLEFLQLRSLRRPQSFSQFQLSHRPRLGGSPFLRQGRAREPQAHLGKSLRSWIPPALLLSENIEGRNETATETVAFVLFAMYTSSRGFKKNSFRAIDDCEHSPALGPVWSRNGLWIEQSEIFFKYGLFTPRTKNPHFELAGSCRNEQSSVAIPIRPLQIV